MSSSVIFLHDFLGTNDGAQGPFELSSVPSQRLKFRRERSLSPDDNEQIFKLARHEYPSVRNPSVQQRTHISTVDDSFDEANSYSSPSRQQSQPMNNNEDIGLSRIPDRPLLPTFSDKIQHELLMGMLYLDSIIFYSLFFFTGNPEPAMNDLIREAADFYTNVYPQLTHGVEYKKIGIALITDYHVKIQSILIV
ncbi:unnamed protein product [Rotaria magnacalcarata]|uniref:Uncharacterized protein n=2 Tax=Rotaria magnacalcarata TaxID=392030 RepID=A0A814LJV6_9BILA|nr:unnamed protein product [Rotaria magnacalcarata]